jgi:hypothetical protein
MCAMIKMLPLLAALLLAGCSSSFGPGMDVYDRDQISVLIDVIEATDPAWAGYAGKARVMHATGHILIFPCVPGRRR